jgi:putative Mg2+ transporter-C (MgtC) family protein
MVSAWEAAWEAVRQDFSELPDAGRLARFGLRLVSAVLLGGALGFQRAKTGKSAGLRTHMLVALGAALLVVAPQAAGHGDDAVSRVIQGVVTGIGFLGGGVILKTSEGQVHGLTTAASLWIAAAIGLTCGLGRMVAASAATALAYLVLAALHPAEDLVRPPHERQSPRTP